VILSHILITRFSYRGKDVFKHVNGPTFYTHDDPLDPARLAPRFELFEFACLPSVIAQTEQDFSWVLLIDSDLPAQHSARLRALVSRRERSFVHIYDKHSDLGGLDWLRPYISAGAERVVTTNLDDDDALPHRFTAAMRERLRELGRAERLPPLGIVGARQIVQWDLVRSADAPLGWKAPWHRGKRVRVASPGMSLHCSFPAFDFCVLGLRHTKAEAYLDFSLVPQHPHVAWMRNEMLTAAQKRGIDLQAWPPGDLFHDICQEVGPMLMTNHFHNNQRTRLTDTKPGRSPVTGPADFADFVLDWARVPRVM
jgi:hypothetical protein